MKRILVLDSDEAIQMLYADELCEEGFDVVSSGDDSEIPDLVRRKRPDLVLLVIGADEARGRRVLHAILEIREKLPIILCVACDQAENDPGLPADAGYLTMPWDVKELRRVVKAALGVEVGKSPGAGRSLKEGRMEVLAPFGQIPIPWQIGS